MATLPDLRTRFIAHLSWWNAKAHGATTFDPVELLEYVDVEDWDEYDNGIEGSLRRHPALRFRAKTDGWIITYLDTTYGSVDPEDFLTDFKPTQPADLTRTMLSEEIDALRKQTSNADKMTFRHKDVALYNYRRPDATHYRTFHRERTDGYSFQTHAQYSFEPGTNPPDDYIIEAQVSEGAYVQFDGDDIVTSASDQTSRTRARVASQIQFPDQYYQTVSWIPLAGDAYTTTVIIE